MITRLQHAPLTTAARRLLTAILLMGLASPMTGTFTNVFLWKQGKSLPLLIAYTLTMYLCVSFGFFLSYRLVGRFTHRFLFLIGTVASGLIPFLLIFSSSFAPLMVIGFGAILGCAVGFLWSNRNYLTLHATTKNDRLRFSAIESMIMTSMGVIAPFIIGWVLELGTRFGWFNAQQGYQGMGMIACGLLTLAGLAAYDRHEPTPQAPTLRLRPVTRQWQVLRWEEFFQGIMFGVSGLLPMILTILFIGQEGAVGTFSSAGYLISAVVVYVAGQYITHEKRLSVLFFPIVIDLLTAAAILILPMPLGITLYLIVITGTGALRWWVTGATMYHAVEVEQQRTGSSREGLLLDREIVLNLGRAVGLGLLLALFAFAPRMVPFVAPLFVALLQMTIYPFCKTLDRLTHTSSPHPSEAHRSAKV